MLTCSFRKAGLTGNEKGKKVEGEVQISDAGPIGAAALLDAGASPHAGREGS